MADEEEHARLLDRSEQLAHSLRFVVHRLVHEVKALEGVPESQARLLRLFKSSIHTESRQMIILLGQLLSGLEAHWRLCWEQVEASKSRMTPVPEAVHDLLRLICQGLEYGHAVACTCITRVRWAVSAGPEDIDEGEC
jgi:hypothetical protein